MPQVIATAQIIDDIYRDYCTRCAAIKARAEVRDMNSYLGRLVGKRAG
jgi:hypothetical protein